MAPDASIEAASFRDPAGFIFTRDGVLYRQVNRVYEPHYRRLVDSGLCQQLMESGRLVRHTDAGTDRAAAPGACAVLQPERLPFISYPYEWCFSQLRDAALLTLDVQRTALAAGMTLKDASAFNIQFNGARPVLIDTLSFETYAEGAPWKPYRQFCEHFLAPLALMAYADVSLNRLLALHLDGVPLGMAARLLPQRARWRPSLLIHLFTHARSQDWCAAAGAPAAARGRLSRVGMLGLIDSLEGAVRGLRWVPGRTAWADYYGATNYTDTAFEAKKAMVADSIDAVRPSTTWDLGANTGVFSRLAQARGSFTLAIDSDAAAVERNYTGLCHERLTGMLPLVADVTNPSPAIGWANAERKALLARGPADLVMALALVHHLAIGNNVPLPRIAALFASLAPNLILEFVPKEDSQVARLLLTREDVYPDYNAAGFERAFEPVFTVVKRTPIPGTARTLYLMRTRTGTAPAAANPPTAHADA